jgi:hypothetical protein
VEATCSRNYRYTVAGHDAQIVELRSINSCELMRGLSRSVKFVVGRWVRGKLWRATVDSTRSWADRSAGQRNKQGVSNAALTAEGAPAGYRHQTAAQTGRAGTKRSGRGRSCSSARTLAFCSCPSRTACLKTMEVSVPEMLSCASQFAPRTSAVSPASPERNRDLRAAFGLAPSATAMRPADATRLRSLGAPLNLANSEATCAGEAESQHGSEPAPYRSSQCRKDV